MNSHGLTKENLLRSFPLALNGDSSVTALADATAGGLVARRPEIDRVSIYARIDEMPEALLDILAYDFKVDWYDYEYPLATKRALIKGNILVHKRQGTVYATRSILNGLYPKSAMEEWFEYGGEPGCFRLNVNVSNSAEEGAVVIYSTEEILRRISTAKRLSAHLDGVSYMVRNAIVVGHRIDSWQYCMPECNTLRCGTWWMRKTLGWSERHRLATGGKVDPFNICPELSGTLPYTKTPGYSLRTGLRVSGRADAYMHQPQFAGVIRSGTEWLRKTLGWSEQTLPLAVTGRADAYGIAPEFTGTLPDQSTIGHTLICGVLRAGGMVDSFRDSPREAGASELTGTRPKRATAGYSLTAGAIRAGSSTESFKVAPELTGTLPEETARGYAITGELSTGARPEGVKVEPEYTGTLPKEAQHGERED